jgi:class 3 adenylate cyclase
MPGNQSDRAVMFADLAGFTALTEAHGDEDAVAVAVRFTAMGDDALVGTTRIVKTIGDALMFTADSVGEALDTGLALLAAVEAEPSFPGVRIGMHAGEIREHDGDIYGATVNLAARVAEQARSGQLLTTEAGARALDERDDVRALELGEVDLKHIARPVAIFSVERVGDVPATGTLDPVCHMVIDAGTAPARLPFGGREYFFCSLRCARVFLDAPDRYVVRA